MNAIRKINEINQRELDNGVKESASWHADYKDTAFIYIGFLPFELVESDIIKIFSQYGIPTHINLIKDKETGKSRGFCYLKYEDYRSCVLAIDNFNGIQLLNKRIKVDHVRYYLKEGQNEDDFRIDYSEARKAYEKVESGLGRNERKLIEDVNIEAPDPKEPEDELKDPMQSFGDLNADDEFKDPMEEFLKKKNHKREHKREHKHEHKHRHRHRSEKRHRHDDKEVEPKKRKGDDQASVSEN